jgi:hypothetical protein
MNEQAHICSSDGNGTLFLAGRRAGGRVRGHRQSDPELPATSRDAARGTK